MIVRSYSRKRVGLLFGTVIARSELHGEANYGTALLLFLWRKMSKQRWYRDGRLPLWPDVVFLGKWPCELENVMSLRKHFLSIESIR